MTSVSSKLHSAIALALHVWYYSEFAKITAAILEKLFTVIPNMCASAMGNDRRYIFFKAIRKKVVPAHLEH